MGYVLEIYRITLLSNSNFKTFYIITVLDIYRITLRVQIKIYSNCFGSPTWANFSQFFGIEFFLFSPKNYLRIDYQAFLLNLAYQHLYGLI